MIRYETNRDALGVELRERVAAHFASTGTSPRADAAFWWKVVLFTACTAGLWTALASGVLPPGLRWPACAALGLSMAAVGFNVGHDAVHGTISRRAWVNGLWSRVFDVFGANSANWALAHNFSHHTYTNVAGADVDLEPGRTMVFHPRKPRSALHRYQHLYAPVLYSLAFVAWVIAKDFRHALMRDPRTGRRQPVSRVAGVLAWKAVHVGLYLAIPLRFCGEGAGAVLLGYLTCLLFTGLPIALVFQLPHLSEGTEFPAADAHDRLAGSFAAHQLRTTSNFATTSAFWNLVTGGQNHQIEHHLLPRVCHTHYPRLAPIVREVARAHGLTYREHPTFTAAVASHWRLLRKLGRGESTGS